MQTYRSWRVFQEGGAVNARLVESSLDELKAEPGVLVRGAYAGVNYKDALTALNRAKIVRKFPCIVGIEFIGTVERSDDPRFAIGDPVIMHGFGMGSEGLGGFTQWLVVPADQLVRLPAGLSLADAGTIGVAGYTAALAIDAMQANGLVPSSGPVAVNGATGGVASLAIDMLAGAGYEVHAITRQSDDGWLRGLGASAVHAPPEVGQRPLEGARWAGGVDSLGGRALDEMLRTMRQDGIVSAFGNAMGNDLPTSVLPFILRGVRLLGINANSPMPLRERIWTRIGSDLRPRHLDAIAQAATLDNLGEVFQTLLEGRGRGRFVVDLRR
jgi:acrylyl-CoA reductase (NADPH)